MAGQKALILKFLKLKIIFSIMAMSASALAEEQTPLVLKPGVTERGAKPPTWRIDISNLSASQAQDAASKLSSRLYGASDAKLHAPLIIKANFDKPKFFGFAVTTVSVAGGRLTVNLNNAVVFAKTWPSAKAIVLFRYWRF